MVCSRLQFGGMPWTRCEAWNQSALDGNFDLLGKGRGRRSLSCGFAPARRWSVVTRCEVDTDPDDPSDPVHPGDPTRSSTTRWVVVAKLAPRQFRASGQRCLEGVCVTAGESCENDSACQDDSRCFRGTCLPWDACKKLGSFDPNAKGAAFTPNSSRPRHRLQAEQFSVAVGANRGRPRQDGKPEVLTVAHGVGIIAMSGQDCKELWRKTISLQTSPSRAISRSRIWMAMALGNCGGRCGKPRHLLD